MYQKAFGDVFIASCSFYVHNAWIWQGRRKAFLSCGCWEFLSFFLSSTLHLESENIFKWVLTNIWSCFHKKWEELWNVILKVEIYIFFSWRIICLASFGQWPHLWGRRVVSGVADPCCLFTTNLSLVCLVEVGEVLLHGAAEGRRRPAAVSEDLMP